MTSTVSGSRTRGPTDWGFHGFGHVTYDDWLANATDAWVARLGAPVVLADPLTTASAIRGTARSSQSYVFSDLRPHIISLGNDGQPRTDGTYGTSAGDIETIFDTDFPAITADWKKKFGKRRLLLYAHGGLVSEDSAIQMVADDRDALLAAGIYPVSVLWQTDYQDILKDILEDALRRRRPEGLLDATKDFMLDRLDDALEPLARVASGLLEWSQMKRNATAATASSTGGGRIAAARIAALMASDPTIDLHLVAHSAGSIFLGPLAQLLTAQGTIAGGLLDGSTGFGRTIASCTLWAPACTIDFFRQMYLAAITAGRLRRFSHVHADRSGGARRRLRRHLPQVAALSRQRLVRGPAAGSRTCGTACPFSGWRNSCGRIRRWSRCWAMAG